MKPRTGFTLVEILITISIIAIIGIVATLSLQGSNGLNTLTDTTKQVAALVREAQSDSVAQEQGASWGVHFDNTSPNSAFYTLFYTTNGSYNSSTQVGGHYILPTTLCYATSSVVGGSSTNIIFSSLSGAPSASATITLELTSGGCNTATSTGTGGGVSRSASGKIFFDNFNRSTL